MVSIFFCEKKTYLKMNRIFLTKNLNHQAKHTPKFFQKTSTNIFFHQKMSVGFAPVSLQICAGLVSVLASAGFTVDSLRFGAGFTPVSVLEKTLQSIQRCSKD